HLRHPRPGGGAHDVRPDRRLPRRPDRAGGGADRDLRAAGERVRGRLRRCIEPARARRSPLHGTAREDLLRGERGRPAGPARRAGDDHRRLLRRDGDAVPGRPRGRWRASSRPPEPGDLLSRGPGAARQEGENRMASGSDRRRRGRGGRKVSPLRARSAWLPAAIVGGLAATMLVIAGCGGGGGGSTTEAQKTVGAGEGKLNIICWAGYCEDGTTTKGVDWVTPFEKQTGCQVNVKVDGTSDQM